MRTWTALALGLSIVALGFTERAETASGQEIPRLNDDVPELARRCNRVASEQAATPMGLAETDPPALTRIRDELIARGDTAVPEVLAAIPHSLLLRRIAPSVLGGRPSDASRAALVELLVDPDERVASRAADALARVGGAEVIGPLVDAAARKRPAVRHNALNALIALGAADRAVDVALAVLDTGDAASRTSAAQLLAELRGRAHLERAARALDRRSSLEQLHDVHDAAARSRRIIAARLGE